MQLIVMADGIRLSRKLSGYAQRCLSAALGRMASQVERVTVRLAADPTSGGTLRRCQILLALPGSIAIRAAGVGATLTAAIPDAAGRVAAAMQRRLQRRTETGLALS